MCFRGSTFIINSVLFSLPKSGKEIHRLLDFVAHAGGAQAGAAEEGDGQNTEGDRRGHREGARATKRGQHQNHIRRDGGFQGAFETLTCTSICVLFVSATLKVVERKKERVNALAVVLIGTKCIGGSDVHVHER